MRRHLAGTRHRLRAEDARLDRKARRAQLRAEARDLAGRTAVTQLAGSRLSGVASGTLLDLHTHILPRLDDGAQSLAEAVEAARAAVAAGITLVAATPHVRHDYPTRPEQMEQAVEELREALAAAEVPLEIRTGGELDLELLERLSPDERRRFGLAGNPDCLLLEFPYSGWPLRLPSLVFELRLAGVTPVLAHPERNRDVQEQPERLRELVEAGALVQVTAASLDGRLGRSSQKTAERLLASGLVHLLASDAHGIRLRGFDFAAARRRIGDEALARRLTEEAPAAIASGAPLPNGSA